MPIDENRIAKMPILSESALYESSAVMIDFRLIRMVVAAPMITIAH